MKINPIKEYSAEKFFGLEKADDLIAFGIENLIKLKCNMMEKYKIADLGVVIENDFSALLSKQALCEKKLAKFKENGLATLTIMSPEFNHKSASEMSTHTIGIVINKNINQHFYPTKPEILIMDSLGDNYAGAKKNHDLLIQQFLRPLFPDSKITIAQIPQQTNNSLSCLNWTLANLKVARENMGRTDILSLLPKSSDFPQILEEQKQFSQNNPYNL